MLLSAVWNAPVVSIFAIISSPISSLASSRVPHGLLLNVFRHQNDDPLG